MSQEQSIYNHLKSNPSSLQGDDFSEFEHQEDDEQAYFANFDHYEAHCEGGVEIGTRSVAFETMTPESSRMSTRKENAPSDPRSFYSKNEIKSVPERQFLKRGEGVRRKKTAATELGKTKEAWLESKSHVEKDRRIKTSVKPAVPRMMGTSTPSHTDVPNFIERNMSTLSKGDRGGDQTSAQVKTKRGEIPKYIENIKKKRAIEAKRAAKENAQREDNARRGVGPGEVLPEEERIDILARLCERRQHAEFEFQRFSHVSVHGPSRLKYVEDLAKEMDDLDKMIKKMGRSLVVVANKGNHPRQNAW